MTDDDRPMDKGTAGADTPPGGGRGHRGLLGLLAVVVFVALLMWLLSALIADNAVPRLS